MANVQSRAAQIQGVSIKQTSAGDIYVVKTGGGRDDEYSTFNVALANQARQLIGQAVDLRYTEKTVQKGDRTFTNRYYEGAEPQIGNVTFGNNNAGAFSGSSDVQQLPFPTAPPADTGREIKIMRQTATKVAAHLMPYLPENERTPAGLLAMADFLVGYYETGVGNSFHTPPTVDDDIPF